MIEAYKELKKTELEQLERKIETQKEQVERLKIRINQMESLVTKNLCSPKQLEKYQTEKQSLYF